MYPVPRESEEYGAVRTISRSRLFFTVPILIIGALSVNLIWEIVRSNLDSGALHSWPFKFTILDDPTTATVLAVFVSLFMGRLQWARSLMPVMGITIEDGAKFQLNSEEWHVWIRDGEDYFIRWYAHGAPFPAVSKPTEAMQLARFKLKALAQLRILDVRVRYIDSLGDVHERIVPVMHRLPSVTIAAIRNFSLSSP